MEQRKQQSEREDVISAVQLLLRSLQPAERETLLATWMHEQNECVEVNEPEHWIDGTAELARSQYPIQPLVLDSEESYANVDRAPSEGEGNSKNEALHGANSEGRYGEKVLVPYASFLLPLTASFTRRRWWGYAVVCTILLFTMSLSTLISYRVGVQVGMVDRPAIVSVSPDCVPWTIIERSRGTEVLSWGQNAVFEQSQWTNRVAYVLIDRSSNNFLLRYWSTGENMQCSSPAYIIARP